MKALTTLMALLVLSAPTAKAADYFAMCKTELGKVASQMQAYASSQSSECQEELNKGASERDNAAIGRACPGANGRLLPLKQRAIAVCGQCRRLGNAQINSACTDNGLDSFVNAVNSL